MYKIYKRGYILNDLNGTQTDSNLAAGNKMRVQKNIFDDIINAIDGFEPGMRSYSTRWRNWIAELDLRTYLPCDILPKADIASMSNALELRSPFLDKAVVEFASRLPMQYKLNSKQRKYILCAAFPEFITPEVLNRPKRGFGVPISAWLRESWKDQAHDKLFNSRLVKDGFIRPEALNKYWTLHQNGYDFGYLLWDMLILAMFLDRNPDAN